MGAGIGRFPLSLSYVKVLDFSCAPVLYASRNVDGGSPLLTPMIIRG